MKQDMPPSQQSSPSRQQQQQRTTTGQQKKSRRAGGFDHMKPRANHLGKLVLPIMEEREHLTLTYLLDLLRQRTGEHLRYEDLRHLLLEGGVQNLRDARRISIRALVHMAQILHIDALQVIEAYILDQRLLYRNLLDLFLWYQKVLHAPSTLEEIPFDSEEERTVIRQMVALALYLFNIYEQVPEQERLRFQETLQTLATAFVPREPVGDPERTNHNHYPSGQ